MTTASSHLSGFLTKRRLIKPNIKQQSDRKQGLVPRNPAAGLEQAMQAPVASATVAVWEPGRMLRLAVRARGSGVGVGDGD